jgi:dihydroorotate dehydrogenase electron transfer subunit
LIAPDRRSDIRYLLVAAVTIVASGLEGNKGMTETTVRRLPRTPDERGGAPIFVGIAHIIAKERYRDFCRLTLRCPSIAQRAQPGQFVNLYLDALGSGKPFERMTLPMAAILPRPFSIARIVPLLKGRTDPTPTETPQAFSVLFDLRNIGTRWLAELTTDVPLRVAGPLGKGFWVPENIRCAVLVGGGIGATPFPFFAEELKRNGITAIALLGAQAPDKLPFDPVRAEHPLKDASGQPLSYWAADEFESLGVPSALALDQPAEGYFAGTVIALLDAWLSAQSERTGFVLYGCGPRGMMRALTQVAERYGLPCQVATEERMACGIGICFGCPIPMRDGSYRLCCTDGPVFDAHELAW